MMREHLRRMARYNAWANRQLYDACEQLPDEEYFRPRRAFFGSIHGTLNHLLVGDRIWLARIEGKPSPQVQLVDGHVEDDLPRLVRYRLVTRLEEAATPLQLCWLHLFNHQTHHRGQVHDRLSQTAVPPPPLDLIYGLRETRDRL